MTVYDSNRILTVRELRKGDILHSGQLAGKCVKWAVVERRFQFVILKVGDTLTKCTGLDLRRIPFYFASECPNCVLETSIAPRTMKELYRVAEANLETGDVKSTWRFRQAQYIKRRKIS